MVLKIKQNIINHSFFLRSGLFIFNKIDGDLVNTTLLYLFKPKLFSTCRKINLSKICDKTSVQNGNDALYSIAHFRF